MPDADAAAATIHGCWEGGSKLHVLPDEQQPSRWPLDTPCKPRWRGRPVAGWKIAATSARVSTISVSAPWRAVFCRPTGAG